MYYYPTTQPLQHLTAIFLLHYGTLRREWNQAFFKVDVIEFQHLIAGSCRFCYKLGAYSGTAR